MGKYDKLVNQNSIALRLEEISNKSIISNYKEIQWVNDYVFGNQENTSSGKE